MPIKRAGAEFFGAMREIDITIKIGGQVAQVAQPLAGEIPGQGANVQDAQPPLRHVVNSGRQPRAVELFSVEIFQHSRRDLVFFESNAAAKIVIFDAFHRGERPDNLFKLTLL